MEEWRSIEGSPGYEISSEGRVRFVKILPLWKDGDGYYKATIDKKPMPVSRLVGRAFISNPEEKPQIDHINRNKEDNSVTNLRWVTPSENNFNREHRLSKSGHKHIYLTENGSFRVHLKNYRKTFKTLEEALSARSEFTTPPFQQQP